MYWLFSDPDFIRLANLTLLGYYRRPSPAASTIRIRNLSQLNRRTLKDVRWLSLTNFVCLYNEVLGSVTSTWVIPADGSKAWAFRIPHSGSEIAGKLRGEFYIMSVNVANVDNSIKDKRVLSKITQVTHIGAFVQTPELAYWFLLILVDYCWHRLNPATVSPGRPASRG